MRQRDLERRAAEAAVDGDLARAAGLLEKVADSPWRVRTLSWIYQRLARRAPDPRTRLRLDPATADGWWQHAWEQARLVTNRAWRVFETADGLDQLRRALVEVRASLEVWPHLAALRETEARILMRLGRDREAFAVTRWLDESGFGHAELADVRASAAYRAWSTNDHGNDGARLAA